VTGVKAFGAFVALPEGRTGMVHISEVSNEYVQDLNTVLAEGQIVRVQVVGISPDGKIALSMKRLLPPPPPRQGAPRGGRPGGGAPRQPSAPRNNMGGPNGAPRADRPQGGGRRQTREATPQVWQPKTKAQPQNMSFEDMMSRFKSQSEEKMADLDHETSNRRGGGYAPRGRRGNGGGR
jgi:S1 RNA binding domain protein